MVKSFDKWLRESEEFNLAPYFYTLLELHEILGENDMYVREYIAKALNSDIKSVFSVNFSYFGSNHPLSILSTDDANRYLKTYFPSIIAANKPNSTSDDSVYVSETDQVNHIVSSDGIEYCTWDNDSWDYTENYLRAEDVIEILFKKGGMIEMVTASNGKECVEKIRPYFTENQRRELEKITVDYRGKATGKKFNL